MENKVIIQAIAAYLHCFEPYSFAKDGSNGRYMCTCIYSKYDKKTKAKVEKAVQAAIEKGKRELWKGKVPPNLYIPVKDGDERDGKDSAFKDSFYIVSKSKVAPDVVDQKVHPIFDKKKIYSGCVCNIALTFLPYKAGPNNGITCMLGNIQLVKQTPAMGGRTRAEDDFDVIVDESEETEESTEDNVFRPLEEEG